MLKLNMFLTICSLVQLVVGLSQSQQHLGQNQIQLNGWNQRKLLQQFDDAQTVKDPSINFVVTMKDISCSSESQFSEELISDFNAGLACSTCTSSLGTVCSPSGGTMEIIMVSQVGTVPIEPMQRLVNTAIIAPSCILGELMEKEGEIDISVMHAGKFTTPSESTPAMLIPLIDGCTLPGLSNPEIGTDAAKKAAPIPDLLAPQGEDAEVPITEELDESQSMMYPPLSEGSADFEISASPKSEPFVLTKSSLNKQQDSDSKTGGSESDLEEPQISQISPVKTQKKDDMMIQEFGDNEIDVLVSHNAPALE